MSCPDLLRTQAYLDGELDDRANREAEHHVQTCAECRAFSEAAAGLSDELRRGIARHTAPTNLRNRITGALDREVRSAKVVDISGRRSFWKGAASGVLASGLAAALGLMIVLPPSAATLAGAVTEAHTRALMSGKTIFVASTSHHTVKPWFAARVPVSPPVADFEAQGFALAGGRTESVAGAQAAVVVYRHGNHEIDLFAWADRGSRLPGETTTRGYHAIFWKNGDLDFAAVSDTDRTELHKFVSLVRSEPEQ